MSNTDREALMAELPRIAEIVNKFDSEVVQAKVFDALVSGLGVATTPQKPATRSKKSTNRRRAKTGDGAEAKQDARKRKGTRSTSPSIVKDLNLRPTGAMSFADFAAEKSPRFANEQSLVAAMWLRDQGGVTSIDVNHIFSAFRDQSWRVPANLYNHLQVIASRKGWLDTQDMDAIKVTVQGENYVLHDLPAKVAS